MQDEREPYHKPAIVRLEYSQDVKVSMQTNCKVAGVGPNADDNQCNILQNCTTSVS
jgi:hypothetical protein